jgi:hypothetical protein
MAATRVTISGSSHVAVTSAVVTVIINHHHTKLTMLTNLLMTPNSNHSHQSLSAEELDFRIFNPS